MHEGRERWSERERRGWKDTAMSANNCNDGGARAAQGATLPLAERAGRRAAVAADEEALYA